MEKKSTSFKPELWGGIECSFNRVGNDYMDQLALCGHYQRGIQDINAFADLGIKAIRYPVLWERHQPVRQAKIDWRWTEQQLNALREKGIEPIASLLHHGSGPEFTNLCDESFPWLFQRYVKLVAEKFPWIKYWTPINEPLTTARFSGLYGLWYPHSRKDQTFATILFNQLKATVLAMQAIREINPEAKLVQTEDLSKTYSTPLLQYQSDFENERRWLTYDVLCGNLKPGHVLWDYFKNAGVADDVLQFFIDHPCPPDIIGADHYLTSERYLDEHLEEYPSHFHGGNLQHQYADVEALRVKHAHPCGLRVLLQECWDRFQIPIAITEVHMNGDPHDQIRWFTEVWEIAESVLRRGVDLKAVGVWALIGSVGWDKLLTEKNGKYEPGVFAANNGELHSTEYTNFLKQFSSDHTYRHPCMNEKAWWQQEGRCYYHPSRRVPRTAAV